MYKCLLKSWKLTLKNLTSPSNYTVADTFVPVKWPKMSTFDTERQKLGVGHQILTSDVQKI